MKATGFSRRFLISTPLFPVIFLTLDALVFTLGYDDPRYALTGGDSRPSSLTLTGWYFGVLLVFLLLDFGWDKEAAEGRRKALVSFCLGLGEGLVVFALVALFFAFLPADAAKEAYLLPALSVLSLALSIPASRAGALYRAWHPEAVATSSDPYALAVLLLSLGELSVSSFSLAALLSFGQSSILWLSVPAVMTLVAFLCPFLLALLALSLPRLKARRNERPFLVVWGSATLVPLGALLIAIVLAGQGTLYTATAVWTIASSAVAFAAGLGAFLLLFFGRETREIGARKE